MAIENIQQSALEAINQATSVAQLQEIRLQFLSKKGQVASLMSILKDLEPEERKSFGAQVNTLKATLEAAFDEAIERLEQVELAQNLKKEALDMTLLGTKVALGTLHPLTLVTQKIEDVFIGLGYQIVEGPEVDLDLYNFEKANIPANHPARDMQDTFYIDVEWLLRTHTTAIQTRVLESSAPHVPLKVICPGKVYRKDDDDATHSHQFTQIEGLVVGEGVTMANLKHTLETLAKAMFGEARVIRLRPSYFQFTEPSVEVDVSCHLCGGCGCNLCKQTGWIEVLGAGMVHPEVLRKAGYDPEVVSGFAFGCGVERMAMLKYGIDDIRHFYTNSAPFLSIFKRFE